jgi:hypothetical protein
MHEDEWLSPGQTERWADEAGFGELRQVLLWRWDPIGLAESFPNAAGQYDRYARELLALLREQREVDGIAGYLRETEERRMGLRISSDDELRAAAEYILDWRSRSVHRWLQREPT